GNIADPAGPVEHAPLRFSGVSTPTPSPAPTATVTPFYFPATLSINNPSVSPTPAGAVRNFYADNDQVIRVADSVYPDPSVVSTTGSSTPYYSTSTDYHPIMLNRPFQNVAELGYAFRD